MKLLIVESPTKIKTIAKIAKALGEPFYFVATLGHIKELPVKSLGVDLKDFEPHLILLPQKRAIVRELRSLARKVREVYLATDPDREGEAISFHLYEILKEMKNNNLKIFRLELPEITELGLKEALKQPREVDEFLYRSWKARRVLDRLIGYLLSPYLSKNLSRKLSAGRVQSSALRLIVEREEQIERFVPKKSYSLIVKVKNSRGEELELELYKKRELLKKTSREELLRLFEAYLKDSKLWIESIKKRKLKEYPPQPLKTSTLIEASGNLLGLNPKETMRLAQSLYERGYITYMRTDSHRVSPFAKKSARAYIERVFGKEYVGGDRGLKKSIFVQDAHECIRPTDITKQPKDLSLKEKKLYELIWQTFIASQMSPAEFEEINYLFRNPNLPPELYLLYKPKKLIFDGYLRLIPKEIELKKQLIAYHEEPFQVVDYTLRQHETKPPERFTPQSLILKMEALGIGRPSTYATMLDILLARGYIQQEGKYLKPTPLGKEVISFLKERAIQFVDYEFTANMEQALDELAEGKRDYYSYLKEIFEILKEKTSP
ncbi:MAG: type I DNA topoisomerase [Caldimicrobium sp.]|nr:type I DNA topoisomerase [Caldimicrobium sp.]MCX7874313.1 type I DNA topoisomerase [Caldimicrobium sp.]MDW8094919.1 type I DNA topoisomerase [Caldimicrobium sp.]